jgi:hypothetical protein
MKVVLGGGVWVIVFIALGAWLFIGNPKRSNAVSIAMLAGFILGLVVYAVLAWLRPGTAGALRMTPSPPPFIPRAAPRTKANWLLLDLRAIPTLLRRRKSGGR